MAKNSTTLQDAMTAEREQVTRELEELAARRKELDEEETALQRRLTAAQNYFATLEGKFDAPTAARPQRAPSGPRAPRGSVQDALLAVIKEHSPNGGLDRAHILELQRVKGDKKGEQRISNALANLKKAGKIGQNDGKYLAA